MLLEDFGNLPLIKDQFITLKDIAPFLQGELAIYILEDGSSAIGIRSSKNLLPEHLLDQYGIVRKEVTQKIHILSSKPLNIEKRGRTSINIKHLFPNILGRITIREGEVFKKGVISKNKKGYQFKVNTKNSLPILEKQTFPNSSIAAMTLDSEEIRFSDALIEQLDRIVEPLGLLRLSDVFSEGMINSLTMFFNESEDGSLDSFLLLKQADEQFSVVNLLKTMASLQSPEIRSLPLPDGTFASEIIADPHKIVVEEFVFEGLSMNRVILNDGNIIISGKRDGDIFISTNEDLIHFWLNSEEKYDNNYCSTKKSAFFRPSDIHTLFAKNSINAWPFAITTLSDSIKGISLGVAKKSISVSFCK